MELENFKKLHGFFIEDLRLNQTEEFEKKITEKDINEFAKLSGDDNPFIRIQILQKRLSSSKK